MRKIVINKPYYKYKVDATRKSEEQTKLEKLLDKGEYDKECDVRKVLQEFYHILKNSKQKPKYEHSSGHLSYLRVIVPVKIAFEQGNLHWICHELYDILSYEDIFQERIKNNVLSLLDEYIWR